MSLLTTAVSGEQLDLLSALKASLSISEDLLLPNLLDRLMRILVEQAGAQRGCLLLRHDEGFEVQAVAAVDEGQVQTRQLSSVPLESYPELPATIVRYVGRTHEPVSLEDAASVTRFSSDPYLAGIRPKSLVCFPIVRQGKVTGILYLENRLIAGAFSKDKLLLLELLASQAAISLENASLYREAQEAIRLRDEFLGVASHELRTPLTPLKLHLQRMQSASLAGEVSTVERGISSGLRQVNRLEELVENLLDVSRLDLSPLELNRQALDLAELVREVVVRFRESHSAERLGVEVRAETAVVGRWDRHRLEQVVTKLLGNALKFGEGKPITVDVRGTPEGAVLSVRDRGIGIPLDQQKRLFGRFERVVSAAHYGGLGLSLYLANRFIRAHGGEIRVASEPGQGAVFTVELPFSP
jgi:signal transduction histidine kinase